MTTRQAIARIVFVTLLITFFQCHFYGCGSDTAWQAEGELTYDESNQTTTVIYPWVDWGHEDAGCQADAGQDGGCGSDAGIGQ